MNELKQTPRKRGKDKYELFFCCAVELIIKLISV